MREQTKRLIGIAAGNLYDKMVAGSEQLKRGLCRCKKCKKIKSVDSALCLRNGWPKCCGETMELV